MLENYELKSELSRKCVVAESLKNQNYNKKCAIAEFSKDQNYNKKCVVVEFSKDLNYNKKCVVVKSLKDQKNLLYMKSFKLKIFKRSLSNRKLFMKFAVDKHLKYC